MCSPRTPGGSAESTKTSHGLQRPCPRTLGFRLCRLRHHRRILRLVQHGHRRRHRRPDARMVKLMDEHCTAVRHTLAQRRIVPVSPRKGGDPAHAQLMTCNIQSHFTTPPPRGQCYARVHRKTPDIRSHRRVPPVEIFSKVSPGRLIFFLRCIMRRYCRNVTPPSAHWMPRQHAESAYSPPGIHKGYLNVPGGKASLRDGLA